MNLALVESGYCSWWIRHFSCWIQRLCWWSLVFESWEVVESGLVPVIGAKVHVKSPHEGTPTAAPGLDNSCHFISPKTMASQIKEGVIWCQFASNNFCLPVNFGGFPYYLTTFWGLFRSFKKSPTQASPNLWCSSRITGLELLSTKLSELLGWSVGLLGNESSPQNEPIGWEKMGNLQKKTAKKTYGCWTKNKGFSPKMDGL